MIPLPSGRALLVYSISTVRFIRDKVRFLAEAFRVLRPPPPGGAGGRLLLDNSIVSTGDQHGVFSKEPIALVRVPAGAAGPGLPREDKVLALDV